MFHFLSYLHFTYEYPYILYTDQHYFGPGFFCFSLLYQRKKKIMIRDKYPGFATLHICRLITSIFHYVSGPNGKLEWKRYKQYTKDDILAAIEEVKSGKFSAGASLTDGCLGQRWD
jgi:hypothetical protein